MNCGKQKILYLGYPKTGTSTFGTMCEVLGYKLYENDLELQKAWNKGEYDKLWEVVDKYDVFEDTPWPFTYKEFDKKYPETKFVLGIRPEDGWIKSLFYQSLRGNTEHRKKIAEGYKHEFGFKYLVLHEKELIDMYRKHILDVREYFKDRPEDYMEINFWDGDDWKELCEFLDKPIPNLPMPFRKNAYPYPNYDRLYRLATKQPKRFFGEEE